MMSAPVAANGRKTRRQERKEIFWRPVDKGESDVNIRDPSTGNGRKGRPAKAGKTVLFNK
jgi:hypothetical protein